MEVANDQLKMFAARVLATGSRMLCLKDGEHGVQAVAGFTRGSFILACGHKRRAKLSKIYYYGQRDGWGIEGVEM